MNSFGVDDRLIGGSPFAIEERGDPPIAIAKADWKVSIRRACSVLKVERSLYVYKSRRGETAELKLKIKDICQTRVRYGYRIAWFETLFDDFQFLLGCPPPAADITRQQFNVSIRVRHKPVLKPVLEPFCLCRIPGRNGGQFTIIDYELTKLRRLQPPYPAEQITCPHRHTLRHPRLSHPKPRARIGNFLETHATDTTSHDSRAKNTKLDALYINLYLQSPRHHHPNPVLLHRPTHQVPTRRRRQP